MIEVRMMVQLLQFVLFLPIISLPLLIIQLFQSILSHDGRLSKLDNQPLPNDKRVKIIESYRPKIHFTDSWQL